MTLQVEDVKRVTREILAEYGPDYIYRADPDSVGCEYGPQPGFNDGCLIGQIVKRLDPEAYEKLALADEKMVVDGAHPWHDGGNPRGITRDNLSAVGTGIIAVENGLGIAMRTAQQQQDAGRTWGHAAKQILDYEPEVPA